MGENPNYVFCFGAPGLDNITKLNLMSRYDLVSDIGLPKEGELGVVTYHPVTMEKGKASQQIKELLSALDEFREIFWVITMPNADIENNDIAVAIKQYTKQRLTRTKVFTSLGSLKYISLLKQAVIMVGNSSSGIIEAPSFGLPVVNIGSRQDGRIRSANVLDVKECSKKKIVEAIGIAISDDFRKTVAVIENPYGDGNASTNIVNTLKKIQLSKPMIKKFYDK